MIVLGHHCVAILLANMLIWAPFAQSMSTFSFCINPSMGPEKMQDIITPNTVLQGIDDHQSLFQTKFHHDITTLFLHKFILHYYTLFLVFFDGD